MPLEIGGNTLNNEQLTLTSSKWTPSKNLFWDEGSYNAYAYYPYMNVTSIEDQPVSVATDQATAETNSTLSGYEASDLLYARTPNVAASTSPVTLNFKHVMSKLTIRLVKGEDFEGDMPTDAEIFIHNTVPTATFDISAGIVTRDIKGKKATIKARQESDFQFGAIIVPPAETLTQTGQRALPEPVHQKTLLFVPRQADCTMASLPVRLKGLF